MQLKKEPKFELDALARWAVEREAEQKDASFTLTPEEEDTIKEGEQLLSLQQTPGWQVFQRLVNERIQFLKDALEDEGRSFEHYKGVQQAIAIYRGLHGLMQTRINEAENLKMLSTGEPSALFGDGPPIDET